MNNNRKNFFVRTISGAVFVSIVIGSILLGAYFCAAMILAVIVLAMIEYYSIIDKYDVKTDKIAGVLCGVLIFCAGFLFAQKTVSNRIFLIIIPLLVFIFINQLYQKNTHSFRSIAYTVSGIIYVALPFTLLAGILFPSVEGNPEDRYMPDILLGFFIFLWANDTFAYLTGNAIGKHRLFERISPKKSWEGFFGGLISTVALSLLIAHLMPIISIFHWMAIAVITVVFGVFGDLVESLLKRNAGIKDSGNFLPGHGGILDRFDAALIAAPMVFLYLKAVVFTL